MKKDNMEIIGAKNMTKEEAIQKINYFVGQCLLTIQNTHYAKINPARPVWWINVPVEKFREGLHLTLIKSNGDFIWLKIPPANDIQDLRNTFAIRRIFGVDKVELEISSEPGNQYMIDIRSGGTGYNFTRHIKKEFHAEESS